MPDDELLKQFFKVKHTLDQLSRLPPAFRRLQEQQERFQALLRPYPDFAQALEGLAGRDFAQGAELFASTSVALPEVATTAVQNSLVKFQAFADLKDIAAQLGISDLGTSSIAEALRSVASNLDVAELIGKLEMEAQFLGAYDLADRTAPDTEQDREADLDSAIVAPAPVIARLEMVDYLPVRMFNQISRDPELMRQVSPRDFERFVAHLAEKLGFKDVVLTPQSGDKGVDVIATLDTNGIEIVVAFECKRYAPTRKIGPDKMLTLLGAIGQQGVNAAVGVLVTTSSFTRGGRDLIVSNAQLDGKDFDDLVRWVREVSSSESC